MAHVIGIDLGNYFLQPCVIKGINETTRRGGEMEDLVDHSSNMPYGIPTAFFYSKRFGIHCGYQATRLTPENNCIRYLKRDLFTRDYSSFSSIEIDGKTFTYDEMILAVAQHGIRMAVEKYRSIFNETTNKIALAYPASMQSTARNKLISLIEKVTLEDGRNIEIVGTIAEPAAAALEYLASENINSEETVLVADLGAGTFDVSIVTLYPEGKRYTNGDVYYYDVKFNDGYDNIGGLEFDKAVIEILNEKAGKDASIRDKTTIKNQAESIKRDLSTAELVNPMIALDSGDDIEPITREEFEEKVAPLVDKIIKLVEKAFDNHSDVIVDHIVLTGGGSRMPIIKRKFIEAFPKYREKITCYKPSKAIAAGAARFGVEELGSSHGSGNIESSTDVPKISPITLRTIRDIGELIYEDLKDNKGHITNYINAGTQIPYASEWQHFRKLGRGRYTLFSIYEADVSSPNRYEPNRDYRLVHSHEYDHGMERPKGYEIESRIVIDERHISYLEVREPKNPNKEIDRCQFTVDFESN